MQEIKKGLEDIIALETKICFIDGINGILQYRGIDINDLSDYSYDAVSYLLIHGKLPDENELTTFSNQLRNNMGIDEELIQVLSMCNFNIEGMDALRTTVSYMSHCDPELNTNSFEANIHKATTLIAKFPTIVATFYRKKHELDYVPPDPTLSHGENFLYMMKGSKPSELEAEIIEKDFILSAEHELNPSTFATRITISTLSDLHSSIITGLSTLKGPLHGGARMAVMNMLNDISVPEKAEEHVLDLILRKQKVMGFGHRVYKTYDPRARIYKELARKLAEEKGDPIWFDIAEKIEKTAFHEFVEKRNKPLYPNVDFYSAVVYMYLQIPPQLATSIFAIGRVSGWAAHCLEQYEDNRVIRPRARFIES